MSALAPARATPTTSAEADAARLYGQYRETIFRLCLRQLGRREDAADAVQTTFVYALSSLQRGVVPRFELAWLWKIASNVCSTQRRSSARRAYHESDSEIEALEDSLSAPDRVADPSVAKDLRAALRALPASQQRAILLREWRGLSYNEIASELGLSQAATETLLYRARRSLAQKLNDVHAAFAGFSFSSLARSLLGSGAAKTTAAAVGTAVSLGAASLAVHDALVRPHEVHRSHIVQAAPTRHVTLAPKGKQRQTRSHPAGRPLHAREHGENGAAVPARPAAPPVFAKPSTPSQAGRASSPAAEQHPPVQQPPLPASPPNTVAVPSLPALQVPPASSVPSLPSLPRVQTPAPVALPSVPLPKAPIP